MKKPTCPHCGSGDVDFVTTTLVHWALDNDGNIGPVVGQHSGGDTHFYCNDCDQTFEEED